MLSSIWIASMLCTTAFSTPTYSTSAATRPLEMKDLSDYFQSRGRKVRDREDMAQAPVCNMNNAVMPIATPNLLPPPSAGLTLKHVAIGRGTQNYSWGAIEIAAPVPLGAVATLYNASCVASTHPDLLSTLPDIALQSKLTDMNQGTLSPPNLAISGYHYFSNLTTPVFDLDTAAMGLGFAPCTKNNSEPAPASATMGQDNESFGAVAWLKLLTRDGATGNLKEVYRVNTAGGKPPPTCAGMPATFEVEYAAEYWFYAF